MFEKIKAYYAGIKHVIVYNGSIQERALSVARKHLSLYVTYGSQESNQLMACNDFSKPDYYKQGSIGRILGAFNVSKHGELQFMSDGVFLYYLGDDPHTKYIRKEGYKPIIKTGDQGYLYNGKFFIKGRMSSIYKLGEKEVNLDEMERAIRSLPYIEECVLVPWEKDSINLLVRVNQRLVEAHKLGWLKITNILDNFYKTLNMSLDGYIILADVSISPEPMVKSFDGKIKTSLYRLN